MKKHFNKKINILIVEDNIINQNLFTMLLQKKGWNIVVAEDGQAALEILGLQTFNIILMDIVMPNMDGFETTSRIRDTEKKTGTYTPIIAVTSNNNKEKCILSGMDDYISKPINFEHFYNTIEKFFLKDQLANVNSIKVLPKSPSPKIV